MLFALPDARVMPGSSGGWLKPDFEFWTYLDIAAMIIRTTLSLMALATLGLATINDYEYNYEEYDIGDDDSNHEEVDKEVNYEQVNF